uniref:Xrn1 N-terminal domain-containing protein n=1 Tax=Oryza nivara TaxID=4536 RepID=A0A0E0I4F1_ORYNI
MALPPAPSSCTPHLEPPPPPHPPSGGEGRWVGGDCRRGKIWRERERKKKGCDEEDNVRRRQEMLSRALQLHTRCVMGVPSFYQWLVGKYPAIVSPANDDDDDVGSSSNGAAAPPVYHNLYLNMNGIIHPCFHPQD